MTQPLTPTFGVDLGDRSDRTPVDVLREVAALLDAHHLVRVGGVVWSEEEQLVATAELGTLIGTARNGSIVPNVRFERGADRYADRWHADLSWSSTPAVSVLLCNGAGEAPEPTEFVETVTAVEALTRSERAELVDLRVAHDLRESRRRRPATAPEPARSRRQQVVSRLSGAVARRRPHDGVLVPTAGPNRQTEHRLLDRCPRTGMEFFRLGDHAWSIPGMDSDRSDAMLARLHNTIDRTSSWSVPWSVGTLVVYDNRMILHRRAGVAGSDPGRVLRRTMAEWLGPSGS